MKLVIANKCYSSWSLRPWLLMRHFGLPVGELVVPFGPSFHDPAWKAEIRRYSPAGKVPVLVHGDIRVWESLAIIEYVAERYAHHPIWPLDPAARAMARSIAAEMHAGFGALRNACPMNLGKRFAPRDRGPAVAADVARITGMWTEARSRFGAAGPYLFGHFSAADAMYAPVAVRFRAYSIPLDPVSEAYVEAIYANPAFQLWRKGALAENWIVPEDEVDEPVLENYRPHLKEATP